MSIWAMVELVRDWRWVVESLGMSFLGSVGGEERG